MSDPRRFMAVASKSHCEIAGELSERIKAVIHEHDDRIPLALVIGVLRIVEQELIEESK